MKLTDVNEIEGITSNQIAKHVYRSTITEVVVPKIITLGELGNIANIGTFVRIENAFFSSDLKGKSFVDPIEDFDTKRKIETCQGPSYESSFIETSSFSSFANKALPEGGGFIDAVVSKDFGGDFTVLVLNNSDDLHLDEDRCTPLSLSDFSKTLLIQDFEATSGEISISNWTNYIEAGSKNWRSYTDASSLSQAARIGSYKSGDEAYSFLVNYRRNKFRYYFRRIFNFRNINLFCRWKYIRSISFLKIGTRIETTITTAKWVSLPARIASNNDDFNSFKNSTFINLSQYSGVVHIAFKYSGNGNENFDGTYELDNITIIAR